MLKSLLVVFGVFLTISGCGSPQNTESEATSPEIYVVNCFETAQKPVELVLYCADAGQILSEIKWTTWSEPIAQGTGISYANDCEPSCAEGNDVISNVEISLINPITSSDGKRVFSQVEIQYDKVQPSGVMDEVLDLPTDIFN